MNRSDIVEGVDPVRHVGNVFALEAANDVEDRIDTSNMAEELVAQTFPLTRAGDQSRNIDELHCRGDDAFGHNHPADLIHARVGHGDGPHIGVDRAERIVRGLRAASGQRVKES